MPKARLQQRRFADGELILAGDFKGTLMLEDQHGILLRCFVADKCRFHKVHCPWSMTLVGMGTFPAANEILISAYGKGAEGLFWLQTALANNPSAAIELDSALEGKEADDILRSLLFPFVDRDPVHTPFVSWCAKRKTRLPALKAFLRLWRAIGSPRRLPRHNDADARLVGELLREVDAEEPAR